MLLHIIITRKLVVKFTICWVWLNWRVHYFIVLTYSIIFGSHWLSSFMFRINISGARNDLWHWFFHFNGKWRLFTLNLVIVRDDEVSCLSNASCRFSRILEPAPLIYFNVLFLDFIVLDCGCRLS